MRSMRIVVSRQVVGRQISTKGQKNNEAVTALPFLRPAAIGLPGMNTEKAGQVCGIAAGGRPWNVGASLAVSPKRYFQGRPV